MSPVVFYLISSVFPFFLKTGIYYGVFRIRSINAALLTCLIIAGAPELLAIIPFPLPEVISRLIGIGIAVYLCVQYTEAEIYPDGVLIPCGVEIFTLVLMQYVIIPLLV